MKYTNSTEIIFIIFIMISVDCPFSVFILYLSKALDLTDYLVHLEALLLSFNVSLYHMHSCLSGLLYSYLFFCFNHLMLRFLRAPEYQDLAPSSVLSPEVILFTPLSLNNYQPVTFTFTTSAQNLISELQMHKFN